MIVLKLLRRHLEKTNSTFNEVKQKKTFVFFSFYFFSFHEPVVFHTCTLNAVLSQS